MECKRFKGSIIRDGEGATTYYLDQLSEEDNIWISSKFMARHLIRTYGITPQQYCNIVVYGGIENTPKCPFCGKDRAWWRLSNQYYATCSNSKCINSKHSSDNARHWSEYTDEEYKNLCSKLGFASGDKLLRARAEWSRLMQVGDPLAVYKYYIAISIDKRFKFGIANDIDQRVRMMKYINLKVINSGSLREMNNLEYYTKFYLGTSSEYLSLSELSKFRSAYIKALDHVSE